MSRTQIDASLIPSSQNSPNILYNGGFEIHQNTNSNSLNNLINNDYFFDGWKFNKNSNRQMNGGYETGVGNVYEGSGSLKADSLSGNGVTDYIFQSVETFAQLANKTITLTIAVKTNAANAVRAFISFGGPGSTTYLGSFHTGGNTFEILTVTGTMGTAPSSVNIGVTIEAQSTTYIDAAMAVIGSSKISFIPGDSAMELMRCQRYYEKTYDVGQPPGTNTGSGTVYIPMAGANTSVVQYGSVQYKVLKRTTPTITGYTASGTSGQWQVRDNGGTINNNGNTDIDQVSPTNFRIRITSITSSPITASSSSNWYIAYGHWVADARL